MNWHPRDWYHSQNSKTNIKRGVTGRIRKIRWQIFLTGYRMSKKIWKEQNCMHPHTALQNQIQNILRKWQRNQGSTIFILTSQKTEIATYAWEPKMTRAPCRRRTGEALLRAEKFGLDNGRSQSPLWGMWIKRQSPVRCRGTRSCCSMDSILSVWNEVFTWDGQKFVKCLEPSHRPKVAYTDNSMEFGKACEGLSWNHRTSTPHRSETKGTAERAVRRVKEGTSAVLLQSGLDERSWSDSMECFCFLRNVQDLLGDRKTPYERRFGNPFKGPVTPLGALIENHPNCSILWISRCILVAILATFFPTIPIRLESREPCRKEVRRRLRPTAKARNVWCCASKGVRKSLREVWDLWSIRNADERKEVVQASRRLLLPDSKFKFGYPQASRQENVPQATRKLVLEDQNQTESDERKYPNSTSSRKLAASSPEMKKNLEYTSHQNMSKIFQCLRKKLGKSCSDAQFPTNVLKWGMFMTSSMKAAIHLGPNYVSNSEIYRNAKFEDVECVCSTLLQKLVTEHSEEILNVKCFEYSSPSWARSVLANDQAIRWAKAKVCVDADSVLCVGQMKDTPVQKQ